MNLSDESIILRPFVLEDADEHLAGEDEKMAKWLSGGKSTLEGVENWIKKNDEYWKNNGPVFTFAIKDSHTHQLVGMVEANSNYEKVAQISEGEVNISYGIYPHARGKGYATKAILLLLEFLKQNGFKKAIIAINPENLESLKVPERVGFVKDKEITTSKNEHLLIFTKSL